MYFEIYLDDLLIDEPQGFADIILNMKRDDNWHGIFFEASTSDLQFYGAAANYLQEKKRLYGLKANVVFRALQSCGIYEDLETILEGKLDFRKYSETCGTSCSVTIPIEQTGCLMTLRNRYDQKVDMDSTVAFDKVTALQVYNKLGFEITLPPQELLASLDAQVENSDVIDQEGDTSGSSTSLIRPTYNTIRFNSIETGQPQPENNFRNTDFFDLPISPQLLYEVVPKCFTGSFDYDIRLKGTYDLTTNGVMGVTLVKARLVTWDGVGEINNDATVISETIFFTGAATFPQSGAFDTTYTGTISLTDGIGLYAYIEIKTDKLFPVSTLFMNVTFDSDTYFILNGIKSCQATQARVYAINESLSHVVEAITDSCLKIKSDYFGRTDSQPYSGSEDGCGSLRIITSGLYIRLAENPKLFSSVKDLFDGLRAIDNIGMGIETNPNLPNAEWLRIEPVEYFYQDREVLSFPFVPAAKKAIQEQLHYSLIKVGYNKWEVENFNGLDEFNSTKEFRTGLNAVNNTLDIASNLIAAGYVWETTRDQSFADTGAADNKYDNDIFIACVERDAYGFHIEQGNIQGGANMFSPATAYNWRIRPFNNLMRWFKSIINSYPNLIDTTNKLFFSSGTGNFLASGEIAGAYPTCKLENGQKAENKDLYINDFANQAEATPLWKPEYITFAYDLSVRDYKALKADPYGFISVQCGTGEYVKGYIQEARYRLNKGVCDFTLKLKWE
jgi:hypothetical protein